LDDTPLEHVRSRHPFSTRGRIPAGLFIPVPGGRGWLRAKLNSSHFTLIEPRDSSESLDDVTDLSNLGPSPTLSASRGDGRGGGHHGGAADGAADRAQVFLSSGSRASASGGTTVRQTSLAGGERETSTRQGSETQLPPRERGQTGTERLSGEGDVRESGSGRGKGGDGDKDDGAHGGQWLGIDDAHALADAFGY
jgi:hypothetical protein